MRRHLSSLTTVVLLLLMPPRAGWGQGTSAVAAVQQILLSHVGAFGLPQDLFFLFAAVHRMIASIAAGIWTTPKKICHVCLAKTSYIERILGIPAGLRKSARG